MSTATIARLPLSEAQAAEVLGHLIAVDPSKAVDDLKAAYADVLDRLDDRIARYADPRSNIPLGGVLPDMVNGYRLGVDLRTRLAAMSKLGAEVGEVRELPEGSEAEVIYAMLRAAGGQRFLDALRRDGAKAKEGQQQAVEVDFDAQIEHIKNVSRKGNAGFSAAIAGHGVVMGGHHGVYERLADLVTERDAFKVRLAPFDVAEAAGKSGQADRVGNVVKAAGGAEVLASGVRDSWMMQSAWWESSPDHNAYVVMGRDLATIDADLAKLGGPDAKGPVADGLRSDRKAAASALDAKRAEMDTGLKAKASALIASAIAGDEAARATLEQAARTCPRAFPPGFAESIASAQSEVALLAALIAERQSEAGLLRPR